VRLDDGTMVAGTGDLSAEADEVYLRRNPDATRPTDSSSPTPAPVNPDGTRLNAARATTACTREDNSWNGFRESDNHAWRVNFSSFPTYLNHVAGRDKMIASMDGWTDLPRTDCQYTYPNDIHQHYLGGTTHPPRMNATECLGKDFVNSWGFVHLGVPDSQGNLTFGRTCWWTAWIPFHDDELSEADVAFTTFNDGTWGWGTTLNQCSEIGLKMMVSEVGTHEAGHVFGMGHVGRYSGQTMRWFDSPGYCSKEQVTLGKGDMVGAQAHYYP
jgi:hypothetical protein